MSVLPVAPVEAASVLDRTSLVPVQSAIATGSTSFSQALLNGIEGVNGKVLDADNAVHSFALDDSIPVHQVTYALGQAQMSLELMMQVRSRLVEAYQQLMNMQL